MKSTTTLGGKFGGASGGDDGGGLGENGSGFTEGNVWCEVLERIIAQPLKYTYG